jgi:hypothetical protein
MSVNYMFQMFLIREHIILLSSRGSVKPTYARVLSLLRLIHDNSDEELSTV